MCATCLNVHILLGRAVHKVQMITAGNSFQINIGRLIGILNSRQIVTIHRTSKVQIFIALCLVHVQLVSSTDFGILHNLRNLGILDLGFFHTHTGVLVRNQLAACGELDGAVAGRTNIVGYVALDGDGIAHIQISSALALQAVAGDGLALTAFHNHDNGDILVGVAVLILDLGNLTGQRCLILQRLVCTQSVSLVYDLLGIGRSLHLFTGNDIVQRAAGIKFDGTVVVLQCAGNGDGVADL